LRYNVSKIGHRGHDLPGSFGDVQGPVVQVGGVRDGERDHEDSGHPDEDTDGDRLQDEQSGGNVTDPVSK